MKEINRSFASSITNRAREISAIAGSAVVGFIPTGPRGFAETVSVQYGRRVLDKKDLDLIKLIEFGRWVGTIGLAVQHNDLVMAGLWYQSIGTATALMISRRVILHRRKINTPISSG